MLPPDGNQAGRTYLSRDKGQHRYYRRRRCERCANCTGENQGGSQSSAGRYSYSWRRDRLTRKNQQGNRELYGKSRHQAYWRANRCRRGRLAGKPANSRKMQPFAGSTVSLVSNYHLSGYFYAKTMTQFPDYYKILGVDTTASPEAIKKAFKQQAFHYHPDVYKGEDAQEKMREILLAYQTLSDPARRRSYDLRRTGQGRAPGRSAPASASGESAATPRDPQRAFAFPALNEAAPAQIDLGDLTYLLSPREVRRLKEDGMLRGAKTPSSGEICYCHRCHYRWRANSPPPVCPKCYARDWREYLLLRCQHCHAVFESEQIRYEI